MINFFRKIRKKLADDNKPVKYFRYAIGEIVLVVIGILIALSINNWNNHRISLKKEQSYLIEIKTGLVKDTVSIHDVLRFNKEKIKVVKGLTQIFADSITNSQRVDIFNEFSHRFVNYNIFEPSSTAFNNMLVSETIDLIQDNELKNQLTNYYEYDYQGGVQERIITMNRRVVDIYYPTFFTKERSKQVFNLSTELPSFETLTIHKNQNFLSDLYGINYIINVQNQFMEQKLSEIEILLKKIEENEN